MAIFTATTIFLIWHPEIVGIKLSSFNKYHASFLGWFLIGMLIAYAKPTGDIWQSKINKNTKEILSWLGLGLTILLLAASSSWVVGVVTGQVTDLPIKQREWFSIGGAILIFLILSCPNTLLSRVFSFAPLRSIGVIGYSFYLLHPLVITAVMAISNKYFNY